MLERLFSRRRHPSDVAGIRQLAALDVDPDVPRYPPFARGLPPTRPLQIIKTQEELVHELQHYVGLPASEFDAVVWPVLERLASWMHLLPASEAHHHRLTGGLFRHSLEVAVWGARSSEGVVFVPMGTPRERREQEPRWHVAVGLAGLLHDIGKPVADICVTDGGGRVWNPYTASLYDWIEAQAVDRYYLRWRPQRGRRHEQFATLVAERLLPRKTQSWLAEAGPELLEHLLATISASENDTRYARLVFEADRKSVERDLRANNASVHPSLGVPVDRYLIDAMRRLVADDAWRVNEPGARVWVVREGVHVVWERAAEEIVEYLRRDRIPGIPRHADALADVLIERGHAEPRVCDDGTQYRYWLMQPACLGEGAVTLKTLRLTSPELLWSSADPPTPVAARVGASIPDDPATAADSPIQGGTSSEGEPRRSRRRSRLDSQPRVPCASDNTATAPGGGDHDGADAGATLPAGAQRLTVTAPPQEAMRAATDAGASQADATAPTARERDDGAPADTEGPGDGSPAAADERNVDGVGAPTPTATADEAAPDPAAPPDTRSTTAGAYARVLSALCSQGRAGEILARLVADLRDGRVTVEQLFYRAHRVTLLRYPEPIRPYVSKPNTLVQAMRRAGWIAYDPDNPIAPVRTIDGVKGLVLAAELVAMLRPILAERETGEEVSAESRADTPDESAPTKTAAASPSAGRRARRRGPKASGTASSAELAKTQARDALDRLVTSLEKQPETFPVPVKDAVASDELARVDMDRACRITGLSKSRFRLAAADHARVDIEGGEVVVRSGG